MDLSLQRVPQVGQACTFLVWGLGRVEGGIQKRLPQGRHEEDAQEGLRSLTLHCPSLFPVSH